jgi:hypothetical protein
MRKNTPEPHWIAAIVVIAAVIAVAIYFGMQPPRPAAPPAPTATAPGGSRPGATPLERHPIGAVAVAPDEASSTPLPALADSDADVIEGLSTLLGKDLKGLLAARAVIPHIVATVDALPGRQLAPNLLPVRAPAGHFMVATGPATTRMDPANMARYAPYLRLAEQVDPEALVAWYVGYYPLFQQAYRELGYPDGHFNDRLVFVIDQLLATPKPATPPALQPYKAGYAFVDADLESLAAGQKILLRLGPAGEATVKARLRVVRALLVGSPPAESAPPPATGADG